MRNVQKHCAYLVALLFSCVLSHAGASPPPPLPEPEEIPVLTADTDTLLIAAVSMLDRSDDYHRYDYFKRIHEFVLKNGPPSEPVAKALKNSLERRLAETKEKHRNSKEMYADSDEPFWGDLSYGVGFLEIGETARGTELLEHGLAELRKRKTVKYYPQDLFPRYAAAGKQKEAKEGLKLLARSYRPNSENEIHAGFEANLYRLFEEQLAIREFDDAGETAQMIVKMNIPLKNLFGIFSRFGNSRAGQVDNYHPYLAAIYDKTEPISVPERFMLRTVDVQSSFHLHEEARASLKKLTDPRSRDVAWSILAQDYADAGRWQEAHDTLDRIGAESVRNNMVKEIIELANFRGQDAEADVLLAKYFTPEMYERYGLNRDIREWALVRMAHGRFDSGKRLLETVVHDAEKRSEVLAGLGTVWNNRRAPSDRKAAFPNVLKVRDMIPEEHLAARILFDHSYFRTFSGDDPDFDRDALLAEVLRRYERLGEMPKSSRSHNGVSTFEWVTFEFVQIFLDKKDYDSASRIVTLMALKKLVVEAEAPNDDHGTQCRLRDRLGILARLFYVTGEKESYENILQIARDEVERFMKLKDDKYEAMLRGGWGPGPPPDPDHRKLADEPKRLELHCRLEAGEFDAAFEIFETMDRQNDSGHLCALIESYLVTAGAYDKLREFAVLAGKYPGTERDVKWYQRTRLTVACSALIQANKDAEAEKLAAEFELKPDNLFYAKWEREMGSSDVEKRVQLLNGLPDGASKAYWIMELLEKMQRER